MNSYDLLAELLLMGLDDEPTPEAPNPLPVDEGNMKPFIRVNKLFPDRSDRWVADSCRAGRIPGAFKIGGAWFIREDDVDVLPEKADPNHVITEEEVYADLKKRGVFG